MPIDSTKIFDAPIPGQSLTDAPGSAPWHHPPRFTDPSEAAQYTFDMLTHPRTALMTKAVLEQGVPTEVVAQGVLNSGFMKGMWTPDMVHLISPAVHAQVVAVAEHTGADYKIWKPDAELAKFMAQNELSKANKYPPDNTPINTLSDDEPDSMGNTKPSGGKPVSPDTDVGGESEGEPDSNAGLMNPKSYR